MLRLHRSAANAVPVARHLLSIAVLCSAPAGCIMGLAQSSTNNFQEEVDAFVGAAAQGDWQQMEQMLTHGAMYLNAKDSQGKTALIAALLNKQGDVVDKLLEIPGISIDGRDKTGVSPLMVACGNGDEALVSRLIAAGASVNALEEQDLWTPLHYAVAHDHLSVAKRLYKAGASLERRDRSGHTLAHVAAEVNSVPVMEYLIEAGASIDLIDQEGNTPYDLAESDEIRDLIIRALQEQQEQQQTAEDRLEAV